MLCTLDPMFAKRLEETVNIEDYSRKLSEHANFEIAEFDSSIIGIVAFYENESELYIPYVCVSISKRGMGVADILLNNICHYADMKNKPISLEVRTSNIGAIRLYRKFSFDTTCDSDIKCHMTRKPASLRNL